MPSELSKEAGHLITDLFNRQFVPTKVDDAHQRARIVEYNNVRYLAKEGTPDDFVTEGIFFRSPDPAPDGKQVLEVTDKNRKTSAKPPDWDQRLPEKEDPRTETGGPPAPPSNVKASKSGNQTVLSWQSGGEADLLGYRVYRADPQVGFVQIATVKDPAIVTYTDAGGSGLNGYYITSVDISGQESSPSAIASADSSAGTWEVPVPPNGIGQPDAIPPDVQVPPTGETNEGNGGQQPSNAPPSAPQSLTMSTSSDGWKLQWKANRSSEQVIAYNVYYSPDPASGFLLIDTVTGTSYINKSGDVAGSYYVTAVNSYGESSQSNSVTAN